MKKISFQLILTASLFFSGLVHAANFNPGTSAQLQADLDTAASNNDPAGNTITLNANTTYLTADNPNLIKTFTYDSANDTSLTITGAGMGSTILDGGGTGGTQVMSVNLNGAMPVPANIQGITFQNGDSTTSGGGLILTSFQANLSVVDCEFLNNVLTGPGAGGGGVDVGSKLGDVTFTGNHVTGNQNPQGGGGGAQVTSQVGNATFNNNIFDGNTAATGDDGAAFVAAGGTAIDVIGNTFTKNSAGNTGGALEVQSDAGAITFNDNTVLENTSDGVYGGVHLQSDSGNISANANTILGNIANGMGVGGIIVGTTGNLVFTNNILSGNQAPNGNAGGAFIYVSATGSNFITNNTVTGNQAQGNGGGVLIGTSGGPGTVSFYNNIVFNNQAGAGQGQDIFFDNTTVPTTVFLLFNNDFSEFCEPGGGNCDFATLLGGNQGSNINQDPLFVDAAANNFQLSAGSKAIDAGDLNAPGLPPLDHDGLPRVIGGGVDMGALEAGPAIAVNPNPLDFGQVSEGQEKTLIVTLSNNGGAPLNITNTSLSSNAAFSLDPNDGPNPCNSLTPTLQVGESCTMGVIFAPDDLGAFAAVLTIVSDDPQNPSVTIPITGIGTAFNISGGGCSLGGFSPPAASLLWLALPAALTGIRLRKNNKKKN